MTGHLHLVDDDGAQSEYKHQWPVELSGQSLEIKLKLSARLSRPKSAGGNYVRSWAGGARLAPTSR